MPQITMKLRVWMGSFAALATFAFVNDIVVLAATKRADPSGVDASPWPEVVQMCTASLPFVFLASVAVTCCITICFVAPLEALTAECRELIRGRNSWKLKAPLRMSALAPLTRTLNDVLTHLNGVFRHQHQCLTNAVHELRTPLTAQAIVAENALARRGDATELRDVVGSLLEESRYMQRLIENVLVLKRACAPQTRTAKIAGPQALQDLSEIARGCVNALGVLAEEKRQNLSIDACSPLWSRVDPTMARQAILNVIHNAIEHCPPGTSIEVFALDRGEAKGLVAVVDDGPGISRQDQARVFSSFFRGTGTTRQRGLGLGLAIAKATVREQGGHIRLRSVLGQGCRFELEFPLSPDAGPPERERCVGTRFELSEAPC